MRIIKLSRILIILSFFTSCNLEELLSEDRKDKCSDQVSPVEEIHALEPINIYNSPETGLSCDELVKRNTPKYLPDSTSCQESAEPLYTGAENNTAEQNNIINSVQEDRALVFNKSNIFKLDKDTVKIYTSDDDELSINEITLPGIARGLILSNENLVVALENELRIYSSSNFALIKTYSFNNIVEMRLKRDQSNERLFITERLESNIEDESICEKIIYFDDSHFGNITKITQITLNAEKKINKQTYLYNTNQIHYDENNNYAYSNNSQILFQASIENQSYLYNIEKQSYSLIDGFIPSSFSLKEYGNHLVIFKENQGEISLTVLDAKLQEVSSIKDIAPGESIYSSTFTNDSAYLVTFLRVDPLFKFNLSNIKEPKLISELKIPGVSHYLKYIHDKKVIGLGTSDGFQFSDKLEVSLFAEEDSELLRQDVVSLEGRLSPYALSTHHNFYKSKSKIAIKDYQSLVVFDVSNDSLTEVYYNSKDLSLDTEVMLFDDKMYIINSNGKRIVNFNDQNI